ncbi:MAG TPA: hypothetical protein VFT80_12070 [Actinomycetota bacterium]|nr:hypothetical protein [Actinomycetota bacterium]
MKRVLPWLVLTLLVSTTSSARADWIHFDPNDFDWRPDIRQVSVAPWGVETKHLNIGIWFRDRIPWGRLSFIEVRFDTKGGRRVDYALKWCTRDRKPRFNCWLVKGYGLRNWEVVLDSSDVKRWRTKRSVTCDFLLAAMKITKSRPRWSVVVLRNDGTSSDPRFDEAPNKGFYRFGRGWQATSRGAS